MWVRERDEDIVLLLRRFKNNLQPSPLLFKDIFMYVQQELHIIIIIPSQSQSKEYSESVQ